MKKVVILLAFALFTTTALGQEVGLEEIVVTGEMSGGVPGTSLKRPGDFILLKVEITNDSREEKMRKDEIYATLKEMLAAAKDKSIELSVVGDNNLVLPLKLDSATLVLEKGKRADTTNTTISVKTRIPANVNNASALVAKLKDFVSSIKPVGRTELDKDGDIEISIVNPSQYRDQVLALFAEDAKKVTALLGSDYKVVAEGVDRPVQWVRTGMLDVTIYVPYKYEVLPVNITSYTRFPHD